MANGEKRRHAMVWVAPEFLESEGMLRILQETRVLPGDEAQWEKIVEAAENSGGFAIGGALVDAHHGAGLWIAPSEDYNLEIMIPWQFVRSVVTAHEPEAEKVFGLPAEMARRNGLGKKPTPK
jgi:hypothetical protein